mmetsp:Transcript_28416/g.25149  ORF Transcript_28416/g.25149 Transcript_28416/m.25149 type:complete len:142 (+) Transcript_28416:956-1381(+)
MILGHSENHEKRNTQNEENFNPNIQTPSYLETKINNSATPKSSFRSNPQISFSEMNQRREHSSRALEEHLKIQNVSEIKEITESDNTDNSCHSLKSIQKYTQLSSSNSFKSSFIPDLPWADKIMKLTYDQLEKLLNPQRKE